MQKIIQYCVGGLIVFVLSVQPTVKMAVAFQQDTFCQKVSQFNRDYTSDTFQEMKAILDENGISTAVEAYFLLSNLERDVFIGASDLVEVYGEDFAKELSNLLENEGESFLREAGRFTEQHTATAFVNIGGAITQHSSGTMGFLSDAAKGTSNVFTWISGISDNRTVDALADGAADASDAAARLAEQYGPGAMQSLGNLTQSYGANAVASFGQLLQDYSGVADNAANILDTYSSEGVMAVSTVLRYTPDARFALRRLLRRHDETSVRRFLEIVHEYGDGFYEQLSLCSSQEIIPAPLPQPTISAPAIVSIPEGICPQATRVAYVLPDAYDPVLRAEPSDTGAVINFSGFGTCYAIVDANDWGVQVQYGDQLLWLSYVNIIVDELPQ